MRSGVEGGLCPHCKAPVPRDHGRSCVECGGSLQKRYLSIGCLSSKPILLFAVGLPIWMASGEDAVPAASDEVRVERPADERGPDRPDVDRAPAADERR